MLCDELDGSDVSEPLSQSLQLLFLHLHRNLTLGKVLGHTCISATAQQYVQSFMDAKYTLVKVCEVPISPANGVTS